ncbi:MAG: putative multisubstrate pseudouridine synthase 7 [Streblomastix strix]|uniref:Putative multisubstrate pseudouridine synthase 7 n=1 Tax=Streblomastix strix TaxID=222440 RepID=A0A5J4WAN7_9EUKA|nr:MAG: putative multisubstrate pseudouridine synthase 7 [Streblomastix strix]
MANANIGADFIVHELDICGKLVVLTSQNPPISDKIKSKKEVGTQQERFDIDAALKKFIESVNNSQQDQDDLKIFESWIRMLINNPTGEDDFGVKISTSMNFQPCSDKAKRTQYHKLIRECFPFLSSDSKESGIVRVFLGPNAKHFIWKNCVDAETMEKVKRKREEEQELQKQEQIQNDEEGINQEIENGGSKRRRLDDDEQEESSLVVQQIQKSSSSSTSFNERKKRPRNAKQRRAMKEKEKVKERGNENTINQQQKSFDRRPVPNEDGSYLRCTLYKEGVDSLHAVGQIRRSLNCHQKAIMFAGSKDRIACTTQLITIHKATAQQVLHISERYPYIQLGNFIYQKKPINLGELSGNRFTIVIRNIQQAGEEEVNNSMINVARNGFINYFGEQRFGTGEIGTHEVGKCIIKKEWERAVKLIMSEHNGDSPQLIEAKRIFQETGEIEELKKQIWKDELFNSILTIAKTCKIAVRSCYIFNRATSERIKLQEGRGMKCIEGDLVYEKKIERVEQCQEQDKEKEIEDEQLQQEQEEDDEQWIYCKDNDFDQKSDEQWAIEGKEDEQEIEKDKEQLKEKDQKKKERRIIVLKKEDIDSEEELEDKSKDQSYENKGMNIKYNLSDVILPQPGKRSILPNNSIGLFIKQMLDEDGTYEELIGKKKDNDKSFHLDGDYRKIIEVPRKMRWKFIRSSESSQILTVTDLQKLKKSQNKKEINIEKQNEMKQEMDKQKDNAEEEGNSKNEENQEGKDIQKEIKINEIGNIEVMKTVPEQGLKRQKKDHEGSKMLKDDEILQNEEDIEQNEDFGNEIDEEYDNKDAEHNNEDEIK